MTPMAKAPSGFSPGDELDVGDVLKALEELRSLPIEEARKALGANKSQKYFLLYEDLQLDAKVVIQLAWNLRNPGSPINASDFRGDLKHVALPLRRLGFDVIEVEAGRQFGEISGYPPGSLFSTRKELSSSGVHRPTQAGICGDGSSGTESIVVSGGYVDDEDFGNILIYTGHGGNDPHSGRQVKDQELTRGNLALAFSCDQQIPIRLVRGSGGDQAFSPKSGYRYEGLFLVRRYWPAIGRDGFRIWRYELSQLEAGDALERAHKTMAVEGAAKPAPRQRTTAWVAVRNARIAEWVKKIYDWTCQFCGERISTPAGAYAEAAHIRPVGSPHFGSDHSSNLLCLCPNCHKRFDSLSMFVSKEGLVIDALQWKPTNQLRLQSEHLIDDQNFDYHRRLCEQVRGGTSGGEPASTPE